MSSRAFLLRLAVCIRQLFSFHPVPALVLFLTWGWQTLVIPLSRLMSDHEFYPEVVWRILQRVECMWKVKSDFHKLIPSDILGVTNSDAYSVLELLLVCWAHILTLLLVLKMWANLTHQVIELSLRLISSIHASVTMPSFIFALHRQQLSLRRMISIWRLLVMFWELSSCSIGAWHTFLRPNPPCFEVMRTVRTHCHGFYQVIATDELVSRHAPSKPSIVFGMK